jgi:hypothetical protein
MEDKNMSIKKIFLLSMVLVYGTTCFAGSGLKENNSEARQDTDNHLPVNISVFYPLSINKNDDVSTNINLTLFYGKVGSVSGLELSGYVNHVKRDVQGFEAAGLVNVVGGKMQGFQSAGVVNYVGSNFEGFQSAGVYNHVGGNATFFQAAGTANYVAGNFEGFQASGVVNILKGKLTGFQASTINVAGDVDGLQVSVVNVAKKVNGVQIGVVNIAKKIDGIPIGLINYAEEGKVHPVVWGSNIILSNFGVKFAVNDYFYSIFSAGYNNQLNNVRKSLAVGYSMGLHFPVQNRLFIDCDLGSYTVDNEKLFKADEGVKNQFMLQWRLIAGFNLLEKLSIFVGAGQNYAFYHDQHINEGKYEPMFLAGLQLF